MYNIYAVRWHDEKNYLFDAYKNSMSSSMLYVHITTNFNDIQSDPNWFFVYYSYLFLGSCVDFNLTFYKK